MRSALIQDTERLLRSLRTGSNVAVIRSLARVIAGGLNFAVSARLDIPLHKETEHSIRMSRIAHIVPEVNTPSVVEPAPSAGEAVLSEMEGLLE